MSVTRPLDSYPVSYYEYNAKNARMPAKTRSAPARPPRSEWSANVQLRKVQS